MRFPNPFRRRPSIKPQPPTPPEGSEKDFATLAEEQPLALAQMIMLSTRTSLRNEKPAHEHLQALATALSLFVDNNAEPEARDCLRTFLDAFERMDEQSDQTPGLEAMGRQLAAKRRFADVAAIQETVLRVRRRLLGDGHVGVTAAKLELAEARWKVADLEGAEEIVREALAAGFSGHPKAEGRMWAIAGVIAIARNAVDAALERNGRALDILRSASKHSPASLITAELNWATSLLMARRTSEAEDVLLGVLPRLSALKSSTEGSDDVAELARSVAARLQSLGYNELAREFASFGAPSGAAQPSASQLAARIAEARALKEAGRFEAATSVYMQVLAELEPRTDEEGRQLLAIVLDNALGMFNVRRGMNQKRMALESDDDPIGPFTEDELSQRTEAAFRRAFPSVHPSVAQFYGSQAVRFSMASRVDEARASFAKCFEILDQLPDNTNTRRLRIAMLSEQETMWLMHGLTAEFDPKHRPRDEDIANEFGPHSQERIRHLLKAAPLLQAGRIDVALPPLKKAATLVEARLATLAGLGAATLADRERTEAKVFVEALGAYITALSLRHETAPETGDVEEAFRIAQWCFASAAASAFEGRPVGETTPVSIELVQSLLREGEVVVVIPPIEQLCAIVVTQQEATLCILALHQMSLGFRREVGARRLNNPFQHDDPLLQSMLSPRLIPPLACALEHAKHVIFIVGGPLSELPLSLFRWTPTVTDLGDSMGPDENSPYLVDRFAVSLLPSVAALAQGRRQRADRERATRAFFGVADPILGAALKQPATDPLDDLLRRLGGREDLAALDEVPETGEMVRSIATMLGQESSRLLLRDEATKSAIVAISASGELALSRTICFASHGLTAAELKSIGVAEPAILLSCPRWSDFVRSGDGSGVAGALLTASELAKLRLNAELVLLTACNTASGDGEYGASAFSGVASALIRAGARSVLVSYWSASAPATEQLVRLLFRPEHRGVPRAEALRSAMVTMRDTPGGRFAKPGYWAAFALVGDGADPLF